METTPSAPEAASHHGRRRVFGGDGADDVWGDLDSAATVLGDADTITAATASVVSGGLVGGGGLRGGVEGGAVWGGGGLDYIDGQIGGDTPCMAARTGARFGR